MQANINYEEDTTIIKPIKIDFDDDEETDNIDNNNNNNNNNNVINNNNKGREEEEEEEEEEENVPTTVPAVSALPPKQEPELIPDPILRSQSVMEVKYTRVMRIGKYNPQKYTTSPPSPPEGYMLDLKVWNDILEDSKRMAASIQKHYKKREMESLVPNSKTAPPTASSGQHPSPSSPAETATTPQNTNNDPSKKNSETNFFGYENDDDDATDDAMDDDIGEKLKMVEVHRKVEIENRKLRKRPVGLWQKAQEKINFAISDVAYGINRIVAKAQDEARREIRERTVQRFEELELTAKELEAAGAPLADFYCRAVVEAPGVLRGQGRAQRTPGKTALGWLFITEKLVIFDGYRVCLPTVPLEGDGHYRFSFQLTKIASFIGAKWSSGPLASATGEVPTFTYSDRLRSPMASPVKQRRQTAPSELTPSSRSVDNGGNGKDTFGKKKELGDSSEDAVLIFDQDTLVHQFWDFDQVMANDSRNMMCLLNTAWRTAVLARLN